MGANTVDALIEYNSIGEIVPGLAESWETSEDQLTWTFHLRQGQKWYDHTCAEVADVTANRLCGRRQICADSQNTIPAWSICSRKPIF